MANREIKHLLTDESEGLFGMPWDVYPRPSLKRDSYFNLNGKWSFSAPSVGIQDSEITVPFPPESVISGINKYMGKKPRLLYKKCFSLPAGFVKDRVLLHFGAVDQIARITLNGVYLGSHKGGYLPFSFDITDKLEQENQLEVEVTDELDNKVLPYGKQRRRRGGMWYTPISGIWQTVWIESVCDNYIKGIKVNTGDDFAIIQVTGATKADVDGEITLCFDGEEKAFPLVSGKAEIKLDAPRKWSPENPYLYEFTVFAGEDKVQSYFALRTLEIKEVHGFPRLCLNGEPYFFHALLDQGYYSDGIYTPSSPALYEKDIISMKELGFNTLRKHIKIEPEIFYYYCDKLGMVVFQDMVNNGSYSFLRDTALPTLFMKYFPDMILNPKKKVRKAFESAMVETVNHLYNHPCICYWTVFNEGWGQFCSSKMHKKIKELDCTRFVDTTSGWFKASRSDVCSEHVYFKPVKLKKSKKPIVLSEFGGYSYKIMEHCANTEKTYGYRKFEDAEQFEAALESLYLNEVVPAVQNGLCASVYTQLSDVEDETNGLVTYDRRVIKVSKDKMNHIAEMLKIKNRAE